jgi:hypothetical protein
VSDLIGFPANDIAYRQRNLVERMFCRLKELAWSA